AGPVLSEWAFYPSPAALIAKIDFLTPRWKWPFWVWTKRFGAWPFSVEWLSAAFDSNAAPFFQSFVEVRVERSSERVRLLPWGPHGRLKWADLQSSPGWRPAGRRPPPVGPDGPPKGARSAISAGLPPGGPPARGAGRDRHTDAPALGGDALR